MGRTAAPATPGTDPNAAASTEDSATPGIDAGAQDGAAQEAATLADAMAMIKTLTGQVQALTRNHAAQHAPAVDLPDLADVVKKKPDSPMLTKQGWYVPAVLPSQRTVN